ncbi:ABC transporter substrate-binding protein [Flavobacterium litorale]|uniref:ABC transporter substrate-binding protein n=1 Tax=Flavobacterium litorale TaxID=2856519 RepID=A0ABX8VG12_9FLAO|nr:ABC transporter substrate-binding protein [Flavobacterium litorale]
MKNSIATLLTLLLTIIFFSCGGEQNKKRDHLVFRYNENAAVNSLDPAFSRTRPSIWVCNQLFSGLVQLDDKLNIQPDIAKRWEISPNGKTYTFTLRDDVYFHRNGVFGTDSTRTVIAQDFEYSLNRLLDENVAAPGRWILQNVADFKAVNDTIFQIQLNKTFPAFLGLLTMKYASVVPHEAFEAAGYDFRANPIGTGAFQFKIWEENVKLVLRKNPLYYEKDEEGVQLPYLEAVAITFLPDKQSGFLQFVQGRQDLVSGLDPSYKDEIVTPKGKLQAKYNDEVDMITGPYLNTEYIGFRLDGANDAVKDKRIRQAMNYGFDREKMVMYLRNGMGTPAIYGMIPTGLGGYGTTGYNYNPEKARKLIAEYKSENGNANLDIQMSTSASYLDIAEYLQREWQKIGLTVAVDVNPPSTLTQSISNGKVSFFKASWIADYPDAENYLSLFYSKNFSPGGPNYTHFKNEDFDRLYEKAFTVINDKERYALYKKMDAIVMEEAPVVPLFYDKAARFTTKDVAGLGINPLNLLVLKKVKKN